MKSNRAVVVAALTVLSFRALRAQDPVAWVRSEARNTPGAEGSLASGSPEVTLGITEEGATLSAVLGLDFGPSLRYALDLKVSGKLESGQQELELANRNDLPGGVEASLRFSAALSKAPDVTSLCREINELLGAQVPPIVKEPWKKLETALADAPLDFPGKIRFLAYQELWRELSDAWSVHRATLEARAEGNGRELSRLERYELSALYSVDLPTIEELEDEQVRGICTEWNKGRFADLLLIPVPGSRQDGQVEARLGALSKPCTLKTLLDKRAGAAEAMAIRSAQEEHATKLRSIASIHARETAVAQRISDPVARRGALDKADATRAEETQKSEKALTAATDTLARKEVLSKARDEVYRELADAMAKEVARWNGTAAPFISTRPGEVASAPDGPGMVCGRDDIEGVLSAAPASLSWKTRRAIQRQVGGQWFFTASYSNSSQNFKFARLERATDPATGLVATSRTNEHNHSGRVGFSYLQAGSLWTFGYSRKRLWKGQPAVEFCSEATGPPLLCTTSGLGPPSSRETDVYDVQWSREVSSRFALQTQMFFEDEADILNPHVILFFLPQGGNLRGGLDLSYAEGADDATEGFGARLFVGVPFKLGSL